MANRLVLSLLLAFVVLQALSAEVIGAGSGQKRDKGNSLFSLFNLKTKSKFWDEAVIRDDFEDVKGVHLSKYSKEDMLNYTKAGSVANYLKLQEVESLYLPVPVNFIFIGFEGKGNHEFKLGPDELERWFTNIDHIFEHTRIPHMDESSNLYYKDNQEGAKSHPLPLVSHVNYNFSVHAIQMGEKVTSVFEHAIEVLSRRDNIDDVREEVRVLWQVDMDLLDYLFTSLVDYLQLESAYNLFILNPRRNSQKSRYGYRSGFSESEIKVLKENATLRSKILESEKLKGNFFAMEKYKRPLYEKHPMMKFAWTTAEDIDTVEWSNMCMDVLRGVEGIYKAQDIAGVVFSKAERVLHGENTEMQLRLKRELKSGDFSGFHQDCLTDTWIGKNRWAFIDLSAGPFEWGPAVGGQGVRSEISLPNVGKTVGALAEISEAEAENELQDAIRERFAVFGDQEHQAIDILLAEIDIYELFAFKHCKGRKATLSLCAELDERMHDLKNELKSFEGEEYGEGHKRKAMEALKRMESWNLFSDTHEDSHNYTVARDTFLAHLGATFWGYMRHVISPSTADGAYHHYDAVSFQLYFITQEKVRHIEQLPVDLKSVMGGLASLLLPSQKPQFSQHLLTLSEDPALAMAFSVARRAAAIPLLLVNGTYRLTVRPYLDSLILQHQLRSLSEHGSFKGKHPYSRSTLEVPIFWFIYNDPVLVDKYYQAKSLDDMVIVVQSTTSSLESHYQCNGQSLLWDLRRPVKAALAATAEHLAGILPLHLAYSHAHESAIEDWIWSVGSNPFSITCQGWQTSQFQSDMIARSYIITALDESMQLLNKAIRTLITEHTSDQSFKLFKSHEPDLVKKYNAIVSLWRRLAKAIGDLHYTEALHLLPALEEASKGFTEATNATITALHPINCMRQRKLNIEIDATTVPAFAVILVILWFVLKPRRTKPKIN